MVDRSGRALRAVAGARSGVDRATSAPPAAISTPGGTGTQCGVGGHMCPQSFTRRADREIARLAARQHGVVARGQLLGAGITRDQIRHRLRTDRLQEIHRGVYLVGHAVAPQYAPEIAALLACGPSSVLSHRSAAALWQLFPYPAAAPVWVTVPPGRSAARPRIEIRRARLDRRDIRRRHGLLLTCPPRTILDLAAELDPEGLERLVAEASYRRLATEAELLDQLERNKGRRGNAALRRILGLPGGPRRPAPRRSERSSACCGTRASPDTRRTRAFTDLRSTYSGVTSTSRLRSTATRLTRAGSRSSATG
jgi:hypothetical protein